MPILSPNDSPQRHLQPEHGSKEGPVVSGACARFEQFMTWLEHNGGTIPSLRIRVDSNGRDAYASSPIKSGSLVLHVPRSLLITPKTVEDSEIGRIVRDAGLDLSVYGHLAAFILDEKRRGGFWAPFIDILPGSFPMSPYLFSDAELDELAGSYVLRPIRRRRDRLHHEYQQLAATLPQDMNFSISDYIWAMCCVESRAFDVRFDGQPKISALVPLADMPNHSMVPNVLWGSESSRGFHMVAAEDIVAGTLLTDRYWRECNGLNFVTYGFCLPNNQYNTAEIYLPLLPAKHPCSQLGDTLGVGRNGKRVFRIRKSLKSDGTKDLFAYLRLSCLADSAGLATNSAGQVTIPKGPVNSASEYEACRLLALACSDRLDAFKTTVEEDLQRLGDEQMAPRLRIAVQVRCEEKQVLAYFAGIAASGGLPSTS